MVRNHYSNGRQIFLTILAISLFTLPSHTAFAQNSTVGDVKPIYKAMENFPLVKDHVHGSTVVELSNGDLLAAWFQGSGERWADDVCIMGARLHKGEDNWSEPFLMADVPGFPDINPVLFIDPQNRLWLVWYTVIANQWETSLPKYRISENYMMPEGAPEWAWQDVFHIKPGDPTERGIQPGDRFVKSVERQIEEYADYLSVGLGATDPEKAEQGTIRYDFADNKQENIVHGSDGPETAKREIAFFYSLKELLQFQ